MNQKTICKIVIDVLMTILMLGLMAYLLIGEAAHEWMGIAIFVLFIAHHGLNLHWHKNLFKGRYTPLRILQTVLDVLLLVFMVGSMISGIMMSQVFSFLQITHGMAYARIVHMLTSYWGFALTGMHAGLHWSMVMGMMKKAMHIKKTSHVRTVILRILAALAVLYGAYAFGENDIGSYMFLRTQFVFFDIEQPLVLFFVEYMAMMAMWGIIAYYIGKCLSGIQAKRRRSDETR